MQDSSKDVSVDFKMVQQAFMDSIRDPDGAPLPEGVSARRMKVYQELFFNNVSGFVDAAFPVLKSLFSDDGWLALQRKFFAEHNCQSPLFIDISQEFIEYLSANPQVLPQKFGFALELAHYEWLELKVSSSLGVESQRLSSDALDKAKLCVHQAVAIAQYQWPVQHISVDQLPDEPLEHPVFLALYRDEDDDVNFIQLDGFSAQLLSLLQSQPGMSLSELQAWVVEQFPTYEESVLVNGLNQLLAQMAERGVVRGLLG
ncbi:HvfC family RiPP maturation protein [Paraferrimonas sedimenticola]|uniref:DUF2063 domain-containing protein n=1 Tax=Paraferrimonas sedimenticola TaxID=375674 RepID=A0AA37VYW6_9GAMM|nr:putative DNA-binding domain-containing protein [Paraferrimonas sedimenticola]GLP96909.1 DUF2063 domain-containing protein [Paraferrimonas sedimenticola]